MYIYYIINLVFKFHQFKILSFPFPLLFLGNKLSFRMDLCIILAFKTFASAPDLQNLSSASSNFAPDQYLSRIP